MADIELLWARAMSRLQQHLREVDHADSHASTRERWREGSQTAHGGDAASKLLPVLLFMSDGASSSLSFS